jgi:hypothetical protein
MSNEPDVMHPAVHMQDQQNIFPMGEFMLKT